MTTLSTWIAIPLFLQVLIIGSLSPPSLSRRFNSDSSSSTAKNSHLSGLESDQIFMTRITHPASNLFFQRRKRSYQKARIFSILSSHFHFFTAFFTPHNLFLFLSPPQVPGFRRSIQLPRLRTTFPKQILLPSTPLFLLLLLPFSPPSLFSLSWSNKDACRHAAEIIPPKRNGKRHIRMRIEEEESLVERCKLEADKTDRIR